MRATRHINSSWSVLFLVLALLSTSCSKGSDVAPINDYCYIKSVTLGTVKRVIQRHDVNGAVVSSTNAPYAGNTFLMTIDQRTGIIENRDSLPYGSQLSATIATIAFDGLMLSYRTKGTDETWTAYSSVDSLNLTKPLELRLVSNDNLSTRTYTLKVNVHQQEGDSLYWTQCDKEVEILGGMTDMKAFVFDDNLMILGKKEAGIVLTERASMATESTWVETVTTGLPAEADLQSLRQQGGMLYISTTSGKILSSSDAISWTEIGSHTASLSLVEKTEKFFYAISDGKMLRSEDGNVWSEEVLDTEADQLPQTDIRVLSVEQTNGNKRIILVGQREGSNTAVVWNKMWNDSEPEADAAWTYFPVSADNKVPCPKIQHLNLLPYDGKCIAFGGASDDGSQKAMNALLVSQDYGITWRPSIDIHLPIQLKDIEGCITSTVDKDNFIWIITNAQVWRGRLNRLGFAQQ